MVFSHASVRLAVEPEPHPAKCLLELSRLFLLGGNLLLLLCLALVHSVVVVAFARRGQVLSAPLNLLRNRAFSSSFHQKTLGDLACMMLS